MDGVDKEGFYVVLFTFFCTGWMDLIKKVSILCYLPFSVLDGWT